MIASISLENEENNLDSLVDNLVKEDKRFEVKSESNNIFKHVLNKGSQNEGTNELHERSDEQSIGDEENIVEANIGEEGTDESGSTGDEQPDDSGNEETGDSGEQTDDSTGSDQTRESTNSEEHAEEDSVEENTDSEGENSSGEEDDSQDSSQDEVGDSEQSEESSDSEESEEDNNDTEDESETEESDDNEDEDSVEEDSEEEEEDENIVIQASKKEDTEADENDDEEVDEDVESTEETPEEEEEVSPEEAKQNIDNGISIIDKEIDLSKTLVNTDEIKTIDIDLKGLDKDQAMIKEAETVSNEMGNVARMVATEFPSDEKKDVKESLESFKTIALSALATEFRYITNKEISIETVSEAAIKPEKSTDLKEEANAATIESQLDKALGLIRDWNKFCQTYIEQTKGVYSKIKKTKQFKEGLVFKNDKIFSVLKRENKLNDPYISFNIGKEAIKKLLVSLKEGLNNCSSISDITKIELIVPDNGEEKTVLPGDFILKKTELGIALIQDGEANESKDVEMKAITVEQMEKLLIKTSNNATETIDIFAAIKDILEKLRENISQPNMQIAMLVSEKITNVIKTCNDYLHNLTIASLAYVEHSIPLPEEDEEESDDVAGGLGDDSSTGEENSEETPEEGEETESETEEGASEDETSEEDSEEEETEEEKTEESKEKEEGSKDE